MIIIIIIIINIINIIIMPSLSSSSSSACLVHIRQAISICFSTPYLWSLEVTSSHVLWGKVKQTLRMLKKGKTKIKNAKKKGKTNIKMPKKSYNKRTLLRKVKQMSHSAINSHFPFQSHQSSNQVCFLRSYGEKYHLIDIAGRTSLLQH